MTASKPDAGPSRSGDRVGPASFVQQRLWLFEQLEPGSRVFHRPSRLGLRGPLEAEILERVLTEIVRRHEALRTVIRQRDEILEQVVLPPAPVILPRGELESGTVEARTFRLREWEEQDARPFDLSAGPLVRARLVRRGELDHLLLWNVHHIAFDAWSMNVLAAEIESLYEAFAAGAPSPLPEPPIQYVDFARWQRNRMERSVLAEQLAYWKRTLAGAPDVFDLPFDRPRQARETYHGATESLSLGPECTARLKALARKEGATVFMVALAAFELLLARRSGRRDFLIGIPVAGRRQVETERLIGCFINTIVIRADLSGDITFAGLLRRVRKTALEAYGNQDAPFERVVEEIRPRRGNHSPLFQVMMNFRNVPGRSPAAGRLAVEVEPVPTRIAMVDLALEPFDGPEELSARFVYNTDLFDSGNVRLLADEFRALVERIVDDPAGRVAALLSHGARSTPPRAPDRAAGEPVGRLPNAAEIRIAAVFAEVLGIRDIGPDVDFFERGGHSLLAVKAISRLREAFGIEIPLRVLFEAPTAARLANRIDGIATQDARPHGSPSAEPGPPLPGRREEGPLSPAQERLWFLAELEPEDPSYNVLQGLRFRGPLRVEALSRALEAIVERHDSLRTRFRSVDGTPRAGIREHAEVRLIPRDLSDLPPRERELEVVRAVKAEASIPFDLARHDLFRFTLLRIAPYEHVLISTFHHIVCDGWSLDVFSRELSIFYDAFAANRAPALSPLQARFADIAERQRRSIEDGALDSHLSYWRERLRGAPALVELPADRPRPPRPSHRGAREPFALGAGLTAALRELARREGATLFMTLLAGFQTLLFRYAGAPDVVVGSPVAHRPSREAEGLIGFFVDTLLLRSDFSGDPTFREHLRTVRGTTLEDFAHPDIPFETLMTELQPRRSLSHAPLAQVYFDLQSAPRAVPTMAGLSVSPLSIDPGWTKFDLTLALTLNDGELRGAFSYSTDLFDAESIRAMAGHFERLLSAAVADPDRPVSRLPLLSGEERRREIVEWNRTARPTSDARDIPGLVAAAAARTPAAAAIEWMGSAMTYAELTRRSGALAERLRTAGFGSGSVAALSVERSPDMVVGMLAALEAGGAYLPLDPALPARRLEFLLADAKAEVILTAERLAERFRGSSVPLVLLDEPGGNAGPDHASSDVSPAGEDARNSPGLAYVIYTSGSTGEPKGVEATRRGLSNFVGWARREFALGPGDRVLQFAPIHFDTAVEEIFPCLCSGATLVLREPALESPAELLRSCGEAGITVLDLPTTYWHELVLALESGRATIPGTLRLLVIGGESALPERVAQWRRAAGSRVRLLNTYGPTEATVVATMCDLSTGPSPQDTAGSKVSIGSPIDNVRAYVLDRRLEPLPCGVSGELHLAGVSLARGYRGRPEETALRFVPDPFDPAPGARLYRTGDLVRRRRDGTLEFVSRLDDQVKIRGFRVEPGEVERTLARHPGVDEAAVVSREDPSGERRLAAYFAADPGLDEKTMRDFLAERLPDYMMPRSLIRLPRLPRTSSGKLDRQALSEPSGGGDRAGERPDRRDRVPPRGPYEELIARIWCEVLGVDHVGRDDDFFDLGGHSLTATRVLSRLQGKIPIEVPLRRLFEHSTISGLALAILESQAESAGAEQASRLIEEIKNPPPHGAGARG